MCATLSEEYHTVLKKRKPLLNNTRIEYYNNKISKLEDTTLNSDKKLFQNYIKLMDESVKQKVTPEARGVTPYNGLYGEAPPERGTFFRLQVYKRVRISQVEVYKRVEKSVIKSVFKRTFNYNISNR